MARQSQWHDDAMWNAFNEFHYRCDTHRFQKLFSRAELIRMVSDVPGDIIDAGAFKGVSTIQFAHALQTYQPNTRTRVLSFDTFEASFPRARADEKESAERHMEQYETTAYDALVETIERQSLKDRIEIVRGDIVETLPKLLSERPGLRISLLHCDLDVYGPTLATLQAAWPRLVPGGIAVFDEYAVDNWGESDAVDEFFAGLATPAPRLRMLASSPTPTAYCVKER
ncbi:MAG: class I SAM-dependent methyltransferase [Chromatiales bacterium]|jgi:predicted O-methyltransferase YrrM|nr:class I SAM-dependent methyltransferase [Chromatiales bacterium]